MKKKVSGQVFDFSQFNMSDIAYFDRQNWYLSTNSNEGAEEAH